MESMFFKLLSEGKISEAISSSPALLATVVLSVVFTIIIYFISKRVVEPLLSKRDAHELNDRLDAIASLLQDVAGHVRQIGNLIILYEKATREEAPPIEILFWLVREVSRLYPSVLVSQILSMNRSSKTIDVTILERATESALRDIHAVFLSLPHTPLENLRLKFDEQTQLMTECFVKEYVRELTRQSQRESTIFDDLFAIRSVAITQINDLEKNLLASIDIASELNV